MTSWAEVVEPSTRAFVDEESEEGCKTDNLTQLDLKWVEENSSEIDLFIIADGNLSSSFVKRFVCDENHELIAEVQEKQTKEVQEKQTEEVQEKQTKEDGEKEPAMSAPKTVSQIYHLNKNTCICICKDIDMNNANKFRNAILPLIQKSAQIVVVSSQKSSFYLYDKFSVELIVPFVRCLHSSAFKFDRSGVSYLEQPNIVTGVPAAVLSWCEVFNVPGILYCCYTDTDQVDSISCEPLIKIFSSLSTKVLDPSKVKFKKESYEPVTSNLYM